VLSCSSPGLEGASDVDDVVLALPRSSASSIKDETAFCPSRASATHVLLGTFHAENKVLLVYGTQYAQCRRM
jgi:hypothetical protein